MRAPPPQSLSDPPYPPMRTVSLLLLEAPGHTGWQNCSGHVRQQHCSVWHPENIEHLGCEVALDLRLGGGAGMDVHPRRCTAGNDEGACIPPTGATKRPWEQQQCKSSVAACQCNCGTRLWATLLLLLGVELRSVRGSQRALPLIDTYMYRAPFADTSDWAP